MKKSRRTTKALPTDIATGVPAIDDYLTRLNSLLAGVQAVRSDTLLEARDYLLTSLKRDFTGDSTTIVTHSIDEFGSPELVAKLQRQSKFALFLTTAQQTGLTFASIMLINDLLPTLTTTASTPLNLPMLAMKFVFHAMSFGLIMGGLVYCVKPQVQRSITEPLHGVYHISLPKPSKVIARVMLGVGITLVGLILIPGVFGHGAFKAQGLLWNLNIALLCLHTFILGPIGSLRTRVQLDGSSIIISKGKKTTIIPISDIQCTDKSSFWSHLTNPGIGQVWQINWTSGKTMRRIKVRLSLDMTNYSRLVRILDKHPSCYLSGKA